MGVVFLVVRCVYSGVGNDVVAFSADRGGVTAAIFFGGASGFFVVVFVRD